jgi:hypothetical protein
MISDSNLSKITELLLLERADDAFQATRDIQAVLKRSGDQHRNIVETLVWHNIHEAPRVASEIIQLIMRFA